MTGRITDPHWMLDENVNTVATKIMDGLYRVSEYGVKFPCKPRECFLLYEDGVLRFDGEYIETESFMGFIGLIDEIEESPGKTVSSGPDMKDVIIKE